MGTIASTNIGGSGSRTITETTMTASDTFVYDSTARMVLTLRNPTAGALSPVIDGDGATTVGISGVGQVDISGGYAVGSIAASEVVAIPLDTIAKYLAGTIAITGGTGLVATLTKY